MRGLKKPVIYLRKYLRQGIGNNDRLMSRYADVDTGSLSDGELARLIVPVETASGVKVAASEIQELGDMIPKLLEVSNRSDAPIRIREHIEFGDGQKKPSA
ncbi:MAG: hypothetical protein P9M15_06155, partial [Candidatus Electryoneaceae bacterium]|nr:hypothetical protein [Candidatus Electryoneaceae bacterium]